MCARPQWGVGGSPGSAARWKTQDNQCGWEGRIRKIKSSQMGLKGAGDENMQGLEATTLRTMN